MPPVRTTTRGRAAPKGTSKRPTKEDLEKFGLRFEGPVPPEQWPGRYKHHFQVIRDIWADRYENYSQRIEGTQRSVNKYRDRVKTIVNEAATFRENTGRNEPTWRASIETSVFDVLKEEVRCYHCGAERRQPHYQAEPFDAQAREDLRKVRQERNPCRCGRPEESTIIIDDDSDEERGKAIFATVVSADVLHETEDNLEKSGIPMQPDRTYALSKTPKMRKYINRNYEMNLVHSPIKDDDSLVYPFLVLEAKRAKGAPGFRSIESQTAFPIRRFLRIQEDLKNACQADFDPLVWFFAYQGEHWRLSAATIHNRKTRVFELWMGTVESQDGALQLLLIVDFIWTWARDVFRPEIRRCLAALPSPIKRSPSSRYPIRSVEQEEEIVSARSPSPMQADDSTVLPQYHSADGIESDNQTGLKDASFHTFLRWADRRDLAKPWASQSTVRHSDIVMFSFRLFEAPETDKDLEDLISSLQVDDAPFDTRQLLALMYQNKCTFVLRRRDIREMAKRWTGIEDQSSTEYDTASANETVRAFVFFRSCCNSADWQIFREMYCIIWTPAAAKTFGMHFMTEVDLDFEGTGDQYVSPLEVIQAFQQLRTLSGKHSVAYALRGVNLVLFPYQDISQGADRAYWRPPQDGETRSAMIKQLSLLFSMRTTGDTGHARQYHNSRLLGIFKSPEPGSIPSRLLEYGGQIRQEEAVIAISPNGWKKNHCPRFCFFVFFIEDFDDVNRLRSLLRDTIRRGGFLAVNGQDAQDQVRWTNDDAAIIEAWSESFSEENMLV